MEIIDGKHFLFCRVDRGEDLLKSIRKAIEDTKLDTGVVVSGVGSLLKARIHMVASNDFPPKDDFLDFEGPLEIISLQGIIANREPHLHISIANREFKSFSGHLEEGCLILSICEVAILKSEDPKLIRTVFSGTHVGKLIRK
ncbi:MAG: DNA-binding protein [bacterium]|nr:DNA-binding protein [bacterium]